MYNNFRTNQINRKKYLKRLKAIFFQACMDCLYIM